jgi:hypothetical protein
MIGRTLTLDDTAALLDRLVKRPDAGRPTAPGQPIDQSLGEMVEGLLILAGK